MPRIDTFTFRVNDHERQLLERLATKLERTQSDVVRWLVRSAAEQLEVQDGVSGTAQQQEIEQ